MNIYGYKIWCNFHDNNAFEHSHNHWWPYHGYISIRPHNTTTCFEQPQYEIKNEVENIYIRGFNRHFVRVDEGEFDTPRITIGFNVKTTQIPSKHLGLYHYHYESICNNNHESSRKFRNFMMMYHFWKETRIKYRKMYSR